MSNIPEFQSSTSQSKPIRIDKKASYDGYLKAGFILVFGLISGFLSWSFFAPIQGAVIAPGSVVVEGKPKTLQHLAGGIVGEILVQDGDIVEAGDVVIRLDPTSLFANRNLLQKRLNEANAKVTRLKAERDNDPDITWNNIFPNFTDNEELALIIKDQEKLFRTRQLANLGEIKQLNKQIQQSYQQTTGLEGQILSNRDQISLISKELTSLKKLLEQGYVSQTRILALERERAALSGQIASYQSDIARINSSVGEIEIQILQVRRNQQETVLTELRSTESEINDLREQLTSAENDVKYIDVISPVSGVVHNMSITTIGGVISPAIPIMDIIPNTGRLIIETKVDPASIDQIYLQQPTTVRLSAFNQRTTPELNGSVFAISANTLVDPISSLGYYAVKIEIPKSELSRLNDLVLVPGMPAEAFMQTDQRSAMNYLLKPIIDQLNRAFKEE